MKIALLTDQFPPDEQGGAGIAVYRMARQFANQGNSVCVITVTSSKEQEGSGFYQGLRVYRIYSSYDHRWRAYLSLYNPMTISKTRAILKSEHPDVVHAHNVHLHLSYHSLKVAHDLGIPVFLTAQIVWQLHMVSSILLSIDPKGTFQVLSIIESTLGRSFCDTDLGISRCAISLFVGIFVSISEGSLV